MSYASQQQAGNKTTSIIIVVLIHVAIGYLLVTGLAINAVKEVVERVTTVNVEEPPPPPPEEPPPPPEQVPETTSPPPPVTPPQQLNIAPNPPPVETRQDIPPAVPTDPRPTTVATAQPGPPTPPAPRAPSQARGVRTKNERSWSQRIQEDYPRRAAQEEIEGTVGVRCTVTPDGRATGCSVTASSGSNILDDAATKAVERYARFDPALNDDGQPISASWSTRVTYRLN